MSKVSIFTPTHNTQHLQQLWESIMDQNFFEWVVVTNNGAKESSDFVFPADDRIKVIEFVGDNPEYVGALKAFACSKCKGDILLELDHDDLLTRNAIAEVRKAFEDPEVGFVYSNTVEFTGDFQKAHRYNPSFGWQYRPFKYKGYELEECLSFIADHPLIQTLIWYAPNHLRAWRRSVYMEIGGHDRSMRVLDDQDIISRTALSGTKFCHIDKPLYLYRMSGEGSNTFLQNNAEIQNNTHRVMNLYLNQLAVQWSGKNALHALELGARFNPKPGFTSVDIKDAEVCTDLNERWPWDDGSVGVILANDLIEHLRDPLHVMKEAHRVLAHGGMFLISVPSTDGRGAFQDPTHVSFWNENSFWYYTRADQARFIDTPVRFMDFQLVTDRPTEWHVANNIPYVYASLLALKEPEGRRFPGVIQI
jgi:SAM-dependent methyltransferase